jgi:hypothetical protein
MSHTQNTDERYPEHRDAPQDTGPYAGATPGAPRNEYQPDAPRDEYDQSQHGRAAAGEYQPATHGATAGDYAGQGYDQSQHDKPSMGQKILGTLAFGPCGIY